VPLADTEHDPTPFPRTCLSVQDVHMRLRPDDRLRCLLLKPPRDWWFVLFLADAPCAVAIATVLWVTAR
jgi:hypothetical protein